MNAEKTRRIDMSLLINANALNIPLADKCVHTIITSPPYYGLRDYGVSGQLGLEPTPDEYIANLVSVFRECKRILCDDGTLWVNIGDSYAGSGVNDGSKNPGISNAAKRGDVSGGKRPNTNLSGYKPKDLIGIPWMLAFALRADGWYLRSDIIWAKKNCMPESVKDRPTKSHEYIFLLSKSQKYYYDSEAIKEPYSVNSNPNEIYNGNATKDYKSASAQNPSDSKRRILESMANGGGRNKRDVWFVSTKPYKGAHYATFNPELITPCILAGAPETCCAECGAPYERVLERKDKRHWTERNDYKSGDKYNFKYAETKQSNEVGRNDAPASYKSPEYIDHGFQPTCTCNSGTTSGIVFDPFVGSGTTVATAIQLGRRGIGLDLSLKYLQENAAERIAAVKLPLFGALV